MAPVQGGTPTLAACWSFVTAFFTSDTHFGDHRTINIHRRPFASVGEMDAVLVERWNAMVGDEDEV